MKRTLLAAVAVLLVSADRDELLSENLRDMRAAVVWLHRLHAGQLMDDDAHDKMVQTVYSAATHANPNGTRVSSLAELDAQIKLARKREGREAATGPALNFIVIVQVVAAVFAGAAFCRIAKSLFRPILSWVPADFWESAAYLLVALSFLGCPSKGVHAFASVLLVGMFVVSAWLHHDDILNASINAGVAQVWFSVFCATLASILWLVSALSYRDAFLAWLFPLAALYAVGFSATGPFCYMVGFRNREKIPPAMFGGGLVMLFGIGVKVIPDAAIQSAMVLSDPCVAVGSFVFYLGCLVTSSLYYSTTFSNEAGFRWDNYIDMQMFCILAFFFAIFAGTYLELPWLRGVSGTFFFFFLVEKCLELPWRRVGFAYSALAFAVILYASARVIEAAPEFFVPRL